VHLFLLTAFCLTLFALNSILCRAALISWGMEPLQYTAVRSLSAATMLALLCLLRVIRKQGASGSIWYQAWDQSSWSGALFLFLYMICFSLAYVDMPSAAGTLIINISVQFCMVGWGMIQGILPNGRQILGLSIAFIGLVALMFPGLSAPPLLSSLLMVVVGLAWGGYTLCGRRATSAPLATAGNFFRCSMAGLATAGAALCLEHPAAPAAYACAAATGALASALGYILWYAVVPRYSLVCSSIIQLSVPLITAVLAVFLLAEPVTLRLALCSIPILGGVCLALLSGRKEKRNTPPTAEKKL